MKYFGFFFGLKKDDYKFNSFFQIKIIRRYDYE